MRTKRIERLAKIGVLGLALLLTGCGKSLNNPVAATTPGATLKKFVSPGCYVLGSIEWCGIDKKFLQDLLKKNEGFVDFHSLYFAYLAVGQDPDKLKQVAETAKKVGVKLLQLLDYTESTDFNTYHEAAAHLGLEPQAAAHPNHPIGLLLANQFNGFYKDPNPNNIVGVDG